MEHISSGVTTAPATPAVQGGGTLGGRHITEFTVFKRKIVRRGSKMDHISANLAFGGREKNIWGYKKLQGGKKPIRKTEKKVATFFFVFLFWRQSKFCGGRYATAYITNFVQ